MSRAALAVWSLPSWPGIKPTNRPVYISAAYSPFFRLRDAKFCRVCSDYALAQPLPALAKEMNAIYIQSLPSRAQDLDKPITPPPGDEDPSTKKRQWRVSVRVNDHPATPTVIEDPFVEADYTTVFEHYLRSSNGSLWGLQSLVPAGDAFDGLSSAEDRIEAYGRSLFNQLEAVVLLFRNGA